MRRCSVAIAAVAGVAAAAGCGRAVPTYRQDIAPMVQRHCAPCHDGSGLAPFPLLTFDDVHRERDRVEAAVLDRSMPPWRASRSCADYQSDWSLTDAQIAAIVEWIDAGAPAGDDVTAPAPVTPLTAGLSRVDLELAMPVEYRPVRGPSDYRCFLVEWPGQVTQNVTGFRARPGSAAMVHHAIAYAVPPAQRAIFQELDDADPGPGYYCPAGPGFVDRRVSWIGAWEPGSMGDEYPAGTGFAVAPGSAIVIQMHYDTSHHAETDRSTFEFKLENQVEREAQVMPWADPAWITTDTGMLIPAGASGVVHAYSADPTPLVSGGQRILIRGASLHMHELGVRGALSIERANGERECLLDIPKWDFHWQRSYLLAEARALGPGDRLRMECEWDNPGPRDVSWGGGTADEMCLGALFITRN